MDELIKELQNKIENLETENSILQKKLDSKDERIDYLEMKIDEKDDEICELESKIGKPSHDDIIWFLESDLLDITSTWIELCLWDFKHKKVFISLKN